MKQKNEIDKNGYPCTEYTVQGHANGSGIEEHFGTYSEAKKFYADLSKDEQKQVQFFSKEWTDENTEGEVIIIKNYGEHL